MCISNTTTPSPTPAWYRHRNQHPTPALATRIISGGGKAFPLVSHYSPLHQLMMSQSIHKFVLVCRFENFDMETGGGGSADMDFLIIILLFLHHMAFFPSCTSFLTAARGRPDINNSTGLIFATRAREASRTLTFVAVAARMIQCSVFGFFLLLIMQPHSTVFPAASPRRLCVALLFT